MTRIVHINRDRLWASFMELKEIGACANGTDVLTNAVLRLADQP